MLGVHFLASCPSTGPCGLAESRRGDPYGGGGTALKASSLGRFRCGLELVSLASLVLLETGFDARSALTRQSDHSTQG